MIFFQLLFLDYFHYFATILDFCTYAESWKLWLAVNLELFKLVKVRDFNFYVTALTEFQAQINFRNFERDNFGSDVTRHERSRKFHFHKIRWNSPLLGGLGVTSCLYNSSFSEFFVNVKAKKL